MQGELEDTEQAMEDTTDQFSDLTERWSGLMGVLVSGLAIATAGVLAQVPVLQQAMNGLVAVTSAFGLQLDQLIRDLGGGQLVQGIFQFANSVAMAEGAAGDLAGVLTAVVSALTGYIGAVKLGLVSSGALTGALGTLSGWLSTIAGGITTVISGITSFIAGSTAAAAAVGALIGTLGVGILEVTGINDAIENFGQTVGNALPGWLRDAAIALSGPFAAAFATVGGAILGFVRGVLDGGLSEGIDRAISTAEQTLGVFVTAWDNTLTTVETTINSWVNDAISWGENLIDGFVQGINNSVNEVTNAADNIAQAVDDYLPDSPAAKGPLSTLDQTGPALVETFAQGISGSTSQVESASGDLASGAQPGGRVGNALGSPRVFMDGRDLTEENGRYRRNETSRRGRNG